MIDAEDIAKLIAERPHIVGTRQVLRGLNDGIIEIVITAIDADTDVRMKLLQAARSHSAEIVNAPSMKWLGERAGIKIAAAAVGITKETH